MDTSEPTADAPAPFKPRLDILPPAQRRLWPELSQTPEEFTLYGGTAIALRLGHRTSLDFDFFASRPFVPNELMQRIPYLRGAIVRQVAPDTLTVTVERDGAAQVSFFGRLDLRQVAPADRAMGPGIKVAALVDLAGFKVAVVTQRAELKDYIDVHALLTKADIPLARMLAAAAVIYGPEFDPLLALKALAYHEERALARLSADMRRDLVAAVRATDPRRLPKLVSGEDKAGAIMKSLPCNADLLRIASLVVWFEPPERTLAEPVRFLTYAMTYGTTEEIAVVRSYVELDDFREALEQAPPGIMDERSWAYWNIVTGRYPVPPMPRRIIP